MPLRAMRSQWNLGVETSSMPAVVPAAEDVSIPGEKQFGELLCLERNRAERSRKPFLLMLLDLRKVLVNGNSGKVFQNMWAAGCSASRDSDIRGWYMQGAILGVIFVEVKPEGPVPVSDIIHTKVASALSRHLTKDEVDRIDILMYLQPDSASNWDKWSGLYRDLREREVAGKLSRAMKRGLDIAGSATAAIAGGRAAIRILLSRRDELLVVTGLGSTSWDAASLGDDARNFYLWGAMGAAAMVGLGLALARTTSTCPLTEITPSRSTTRSPARPITRLTVAPRPGLQMPVAAAGSRKEMMSPRRTPRFPDSASSSPSGRLPRQAPSAGFAQWIVGSIEWPTST